MLLDIVGALSKHPGVGSLVGFCANIVGEIETGTGVFNDSIKNEIILDIEYFKAEMIKELLEDLTLSEGLDADIRVAVDALIKNSTNMWLKSLNSTGAFANEVVGAGIGAVAGGALAKATCGLSVATQMAYNGLIATGMEAMTGQSNDAWKKYLTETDNYAETLENALDIYLIRTKPQLVDALETFKDNPTLKNYEVINNSSYSGKLQAWVMQTMQFNELYYATKGLAAVGDENYYESVLGNEDMVVWRFWNTVSKGLWKMFT